MKPFLIAAGLLMTGASVYGIVDYNKKSGTTAFKTLYTEKEIPAETAIPAAASLSKSTAVAVPTTKEVVKEKSVIKSSKNKIVKKKNKQKRKLRLEEFSRGKLG